MRCVEHGKLKERDMNKASSAAAVAVIAALAVAGPVRAAEELIVVEAGFGSYLADADGRAVYLFTADSQGEAEARQRTGEPLWPELVNGREIVQQRAQSTCYDDCAAAWPPVVAPTAPVAGDQVEAEQVELLQRRDAQAQVTYAGWPLYYFVRDSAPGDVSGHGIASFGGSWHLVSPDGEAIDND
jgi:predicted lipoprotein with Yx(FWY)xxD motif